MGDESDDLKPPATSKSDILHSIAKAGAGSVPFVGSALTELFVNLVKPPYDRRRRQWMEDVAEKLKELEEREQVDLADLQQDEAFITTIAQASEAAIRTHIEDKRTALRNAVVNSALPGAPEESLRSMFVHWVDQFTEWHLRLLKLFQKPPPVDTALIGSLPGVIDTHLPGLKGRADFRDLLWEELHDRKLVTTGVLKKAISSKRGLRSKRTTEFGDQFLRFIEEPDEQ